MKVVKVVEAVVQQTSAVDQPASATCFVERKACRDERAGRLAGDPDAGGPGADDDDAQVGERCRADLRMPPTIAATATAAVPWMSSLNEQIVSRWAFSRRLALR